MRHHQQFLDNFRRPGDEQQPVHDQGFLSRDIDISCQFQNPDSFFSITESDCFVAGSLVHNVAESGDAAILAGDDFTAGFQQFRFAAPQFFVAV